MSRVIQTIGIRGLRVIRSEQKAQHIEITAEWVGRRRPPCPECKHRKPWIHGECKRTLRHLEILDRYSRLQVIHPRFRCPKCEKTFNPPLPGISPGKQSSEPFRERIAKLHHEGICSSTMARMARIGSATVERIYRKRYTEHHYRRATEGFRLPGWKKHPLSAKSY